MTTTINASPTNGIVQTADGSGVMKLQSNGVTTNALAWVNYKGTSTRVINASYNVSSVTYVGTGNYTLNFTTTMADANYAAVGTVTTALGTGGQFNGQSGQTTSAFTFFTTNYSGAAYADAALVSVVIFGN